MEAIIDTIPDGYCHCGCGEKTRRAPYAIKARGLKRGDPHKFVSGHNSRVAHPRVLSPVEYAEEDRGYETPCWIWQKGVDHKGSESAYGRKWHEGRYHPAHRFYYERQYGPLPAGLAPDHLCKVTLCVRPDHLEPVTTTENNRRSRSTPLTDGDVENIRKTYDAGKTTQKELASLYGVRQATISRIVRRVRWA